MRRLPSLALLATLLVASPAAALSPAGKAGKAALEKAQCNRCHDVTHVGGKDGVEPFKREMHCVNCHVWILSSRGDEAVIAARREEFPDWDRYLTSIVHLKRLPDLGTLLRKVRPGFVRRFLDAPFDLRPHLEEAMIPVQLSTAEKDALVTYLRELNGRAAVADLLPAVAPARERITAGEERFRSLGCPMCHTLGNTRFQPGFTGAFFAALGPQAALAPNLRHVRDRIPRSALVRYVQDPTSVDPRSTMPRLKVSPEEAELLADFLLHGHVEYAGGETVDPSPQIPVLDRKVTYDEVFDGILGKICVHCHMDPASNNGDGGAGNTGGLGFTGLKLNLETYAGLVEGLVREGRRVSVLEPATPGEPPLLLSALLRRHAEAGRDFRPAFADAPTLGPGPDPKVGLGMPLGLPPLSLQQMSLIKTWLAQGAPGPATDRAGGGMMDR